MFKTINSRLIGISVAIVVLAILVTSFVSYRFAKSILLEDINQELRVTSMAYSQRISLWTKMQKDIVVSMAPIAKLDDPLPSLQQALSSGRLDLAYVGHTDKRMISIPVRKRSPDYDPTARPWYKG